MRQACARFKLRAVQHGPFKRQVNVHSPIAKRVQQNNSADLGGEKRKEGALVLRMTWKGVIGGRNWAWARRW